MRRIIFLIAIVFAFNTTYAQQALKIYRNDGSISYIYTSAVDSIKFESPLPLAIGDTYEGGIIFYLDASGLHGLVATPTDQSGGIEWYNGSYTTIGATGDGLGAGEINTFMIIGNQGIGNYAARLCANWSLYGYTDWYLPSKYELNLMYTNLKLNGFGDFAGDYYWSSTEASSTNAWLQSFNFGNQFYDLKNNDVIHVRAVRAF